MQPDDALDRAHDFARLQRWPASHAVPAQQQFARDLLIPPLDYGRLLISGGRGAIELERFAREIGVSPGIVLGRLQHDGHVPWATSLNRALKRRYTWPVPTGS